MKGKFLCFIHLDRSVYEAYFSTYPILTESENKVTITTKVIVTTYDNLNKLLKVLIRPIYDLKYSTLRDRIIKNAGIVSIPGAEIELVRMNDITEDSLTELTSDIETSDMINLPSKFFYVS